MTVKRYRRRARRVIMRELRRHWHRCFWTWPIGHDWPRPKWAATTPSKASKCRECGKPCETILLPSIECYSERDLLDLADETLPHDSYQRLGDALMKLPHLEEVLR